jgi:peroxin-3
LRRRFEQNQEDCTFTVLALLPTATTNILEAMNTEKITYEIQQMKGSAVARTRSIGSATPPSISETNATDDDGRSIISVSVQSEAAVHTTQIAAPTPLTTIAPDSGTAEATQEAMLTRQKSRKTKRQLWDDLTISCKALYRDTSQIQANMDASTAITRAYTLLYTLGLLTMLTRIQLNLLGRRSYLSSVVSLATGGAPGTISLENNDDDNAEQAYGSDFDVNRKYLTFSWWLLNRGWVDVMQRVEGAVRQVFSHLSPRDTVTLDTFAKLTHDVRSLVEGSAPSRGVGTAWLPLLLPPPNTEEFVLRESGILDDMPSAPAQSSSSSPTSPTTSSSSASLRRLLDETSDLIESPTFSHVLTQLLDAGFSTLLEHKLTSGIFDTPTVSAAHVDPLYSTGGLPGAGVSRAVLLPKILSVLTRQAHAIGNGMPNEYLQAMESVADLEGFAAVVYSSNWQAEIKGEEEGEAVGVVAKGGLDTSQVFAGSQSVTAAGESSIVMVDARDAQAGGLFDSAWEKASEGK